VATVILDSELRLTPGSLFYDLLVTFVAATAGLTPVFDPEHFEHFLEDREGIYFGRFWPTVKTDLAARVREIRAGAITAPAAEQALCCMLATAAWARFCDRANRAAQHKPEAQVLRHIRNAAAHGNVFRFENPNGRRHGTPDREAKWLGMSIDHSVRGDDHPLQGQPCFGALVGSADLLRLLLDVQDLVDSP
jgi:hypothetical protein